MQNISEYLIFLKNCELQGLIISNGIDIFRLSTKEKFFKVEFETLLGIFHWVFSVMNEINFSMLFFVLVSIARLLFEELSIKFEFLLTKSFDEISSIELEKFQHGFDLVCRVTDEINNIFGIPLVATIAAYFPITMQACSFLIQSYSYAVRVSYRYDLPDMIETLTCVFSDYNFTSFLTNNPECYMLYEKEEIIRNMAYLHQQSFNFNNSTMFHCFLCFAESWLRILIVVYSSYRMDLEVFTFYIV